MRRVFSQGLHTSDLLVLSKARNGWLDMDGKGERLRCSHCFHGYTPLSSLGCDIITLI